MLGIIGLCLGILLAIISTGLLVKTIFKPLSWEIKVFLAILDAVGITLVVLYFK